MIERWRNIPEYNGKYQANTEGQVRRVYASGKTRILTPFKKKMKGSQRLLVKMTKEGKGKDKILIQIIAKTFIGPCPEGCVPYHKNSCQSDNYVNNIAYISRKELGKKTGKRSRYAWEDKEVSVRNTIRKIEKNIAYMPKAANEKFDW
jgi:hypothetical protein